MHLNLSKFRLHVFTILALLCALAWALHTPHSETQDAGEHHGAHHCLLCSVGSAAVSCEPAGTSGLFIQQTEKHLWHGDDAIPQMPLLSPNLSPRSPPVLT